MVLLTQSMYEWLWRYDKTLISLIMCGHVELFTEEMQQEYIAWCQTEEGKQYLKGGSEYDEEYAKEIGVE